MADSATTTAGTTSPLGAAQAGAGLVWVPCRLRSGHGVASGRNPHSPYPAGTIALQTPFFQERGIDLSPFFPGTLNLEVPGGAWKLHQPDAQVVALRWTEHHQPETFSFWHCRLRRPLRAGPSATQTPPGAGSDPDLAATALPPPDPAAAIRASELPALIYHPHPETKQAHHQPQGCLEVLAPWLEELGSEQTLELGVDPRRCRLIEPARLRARLLEFLKFRVLAAQEEFFTSFQASGSPLGGAVAATTDRMDGTDPVLVRQWLGPLWPEALELSDADLLSTLSQARSLYIN